MNELKSIGLSELAFILVAILVIWSAFPPRGPFQIDPLPSDAPVTPAMESGIASHVWIIEEIVSLLN